MLQRGGRRGVVATFVLGLALAMPAGARADAGLSGTVTTADATPSPVAGAFVAVTGSAGQFGVVTAEDGTWSIASVPSGTYRVAAQAPGFAAGIAAGVVVDAAPVVQNHALAASSARFRALGVHGGQIASVVADGKSGVFYASTSVIPQLYRTADHGGTWSQVTLAHDDAANGLDTSNSSGGLTASGFPGEVAVIVASQVSYSTDFGVTWKKAALPPGEQLPPGQGPQLLWGHAGSTSVLLLVTPTKTMRADMTAPTPSFSVQSSGYVADPQDEVAVGNGADGAWAAVVRANGDLDVFDLAENPPATDLSSQTGFPAPATFVRLGGDAATAGVPPDALLVYSNTAGQVQMALKAGAGDFATRSAVTAIGGGCGAQPGSIGAIGPQSGGTTGTGTVSQCLVSMTGGGGPLAFAIISGINNNTGLAFDAGYDGGANQVIISGDGARGLVKSASGAGGVPQFPSMQDAGAGTAPTSGGIAVNGFDVAVVKDAAFGPGGGSQMATVLSGSGGALGLASADGGDTFEIVVRKGGRATAWWQGAAASWIAFGHGGAGPLLTAVSGWMPGTPAVPGPNVNGVDGFAFGAGPDFDVTALAGVPGSDVLFVGGGSQVDQSGSTGALARVALGAGPTLDDLTALGAGVIPNAVRALAYCGTSGSDASVADVLFVATGTSGGGPAAGALVAVTGATGATPAASVLAGVPATAPVNDVRVHCASGTVYAGAGTNSGGPSGTLWKSTDGGATFSAVAIAGPGLPPSLNMQVVAVDPGDASHVLVAGNSEGFIVETTDGGTTWSLVNDPHATGGRNFLSEGVGDLEIPAAASPLVARATTGAAAVLVATGGGLFQAEFSAGGGGGGGGGGGDACTGDAQCDDGDGCTVDVCSAAACTAEAMTGIEGAACETGELGPGVCTDGSVDAALERAIDKAVGKVQSLLGKAEAATKPKKQAKLLKKADKALAALAKKVTRSKTASGACKQALGAQIEAVRALI